MMVNKEIPKQFPEWIIKAFEGDIDDEEFLQFDQEIEENPCAREYYYEFLTGYVALSYMEGMIPETEREEELEGANPLYEIIDEQLMLEEQRLRNAAETNKKKRALSRNENVIPSSRKMPSRLAVLRVAGVVAAMIAVAMLLDYIEQIAQVRNTPLSHPPVAASLYDQIGAQWNVESAGLAKGDNIRVGHLSLIKGLAHIILADGAEVIIEGPAKVNLTTTNEIMLYHGRITANIPISATGFTVLTANSKVIDMGTEFGMDVMKDGASEVHVLKGTVSLIAGRSGKAFAAEILTTGQARKVHSSAAKVSDIDCRYYAFVRKFNPSNGFLWRGRNLDLADVVGGGGGFGEGKHSVGFDPMTGKTVQIQDINGNQSDNQYKLATGSSYVDGVFAPDGQFKPVVITSSDIDFADCPDTNGRFWGAVFKGAWFGTASLSRHNLSLDGKVYGLEDSAISMHSNQGITFDLDAIRSDLPEINITVFTAKCGVSETVLKKRSNTSRAKFWVLLDGETKYRKMLQPEDGSDQISVDIEEGDRFLTLVVTDGGEFPANDDWEGRDWAFFAEPELVLEAKKEE